MKHYSLLRRITISLTVTTVFAGACTYGWLYLKARSTEIALREETLLDQAKVIASHLVLNQAGAVELARQNTTRFVEQIVETLGGQHGIDVAWNRRLDLLEIVIRQRAADGQLDRGVGSLRVVLNAHGHGNGIHPRGYFG